ncbi:MAG: hypothetical protein RMJ55_00490, partial [Roseiflexaceae bacterium]|nr:hypothetical protein [Roseiflexaceae bacterium]
MAEPVEANASCALRRLRWLSLSKPTLVARCGACVGCACRSRRRLRVAAPALAAPVEANAGCALRRLRWLRLSKPTAVA